MKRLMMVMAALAAMVTVAQECPNGAQKAKRPQPRGNQMAMNPAFMVEPLMRAAKNPDLAAKIGITGEQVEKLEVLAAKNESMKDLQDKIRKGMEKQAKLLEADTIDEEAVMGALDDVWDAREEVAKCQTKRFIELRKILTKEQIAKASKELRGMRGNRLDRRGMRTPGKDGKHGKNVEKPAAEASSKCGIKCGTNCGN